MPIPETAADATLATVFRGEAARLTASVVRLLGDFSLAEEIVGDTLVVALEHWRREGVPANPAAWLALTAKRRAIDRLRRDGAYASKIAILERERSVARQESDDRLRLIFICCHPALAPEARVALTLQAVLGFTTAEIAGAFVLSENAVAQRLSRARRKISHAGIPYQMPTDPDMEERLSSVLAVLYLMFNEGYLSSRASAAYRRDLAEDAAWLAEVLVELLPGEPEALGLLALIRLHLARSRARFDENGQLVLLADQDRSLWGRSGIGEATKLLERAASFRRPGPYQLQAAIAACHAEAASWSATDWVQILILYDRLMELAPSSVVRLNRAVALREVQGATAALAEIDDLGRDLAGYHLFHATRAELLNELGLREAARAERVAALDLTRNPAERSLLASRLVDTQRRAREWPRSGDDRRSRRDVSVDPRHIQVGAHSVAYRVAGAGPALVLLHGFLCDSRVWRRQFGDLADAFTVIAWDAPGAGLSSDPPERFTIADWAECLAGFLDAIGIERAHILGLSWGGLLAQEFYRLSPARVQRLILADTYAGWKGSLGQAVAEQRLERCVRESSLPAGDFVARWVPVEFFTDQVSRDVADEMRTVVADFHPHGFRLMAKTLADSDTTNVLPTIQVPTLLVWGDGDQRSPLTVAAQFRDAIPNAELTVIAKAGHVSNMEQPAAFSAHVRRFCLSDASA